MIEKVKNNKILLGLIVLIIGVFITLVFRIAYAYLAYDIKGASKNVVGESDSVDELKFIAGSPLSFVATATTLPETGENLVVTSNPQVTLLANSTNNTAVQSYFFTLKVENNMDYSTTEKTPEIILNIVDPNGNEITNIEGLTYGTTYGVSGFDITAYNGKIEVAKNYSINSNSSKEEEKTVQEWRLTLTYLNIEGKEQNANIDKKMTIKQIISKNEPTV